MCYLIIILTVAQEPLVHVIPVESTLGKLSLVQAGDTGTIPMETSARSQAEIEDLRDKYYPGGYADTSPGEGDGCRLWHTNPWALGWSRDM
jgi:DNA/RNA endonuclease YhcR with UshA esterase domain